MSFGDLKVQDLIYEDSSNNEVTVVIADLATKANPTFTGTVTVPTATAGDNSTKAASTAFVVASFAPKAAPAFTGNATGVNLTLSGNLTVNGTQTIINTQTLDVEDKQIEIGKVSSPSDTTANEGGIKLKGASDKTILWYDSTDAWTFNQHIEIASSTPSIKLKDGNGRNVEIIGGSASTGPEIRTAYTADLRFGTNSLERMRINSSGLILVGHHTNVADSRLQVIGVDENTSSQSLLRFSNSASSSFLNFYKSRNAGAGVNTVVQNNDTVGVIRFKGADGTDYSQVADIQAAIDGTPGNNDTPGRLLFSTTADGAQYTSERLRISSTGAFGIAGANYGSSGQVLTSGGSGAAPSWTSISAAPTVELVADGAIGNNVACNLTAAGKVQAVTQINAGVNTSTGLSSFNNYHTFTHDSDHNFVVHWYQESSTGYLKLQVGTITSTNGGDVTWGSGINIDTASGGHTYIGACYDKQTNRHLVGYKGSSNWYLHVIQLNANGTVAGIGSATQLSSPYNGRLFISENYDSTYQMIVSFKYGTNDPVKYVLAAINAGSNSLSLTSQNNSIGQSHNYATPFFSLTYKGDRTTVFARRAGNYINFNTLSGGIFGSTQNFGDSSQSKPDVTYDPDSDKLICFVKQGSSIEYFIGTINSNTTISFAGNYGFRNNVDNSRLIQSSIAYNPTNKTHYIAWNANNSYSGGNKLIITPFTVASSGTPSFGTDLIVGSSAANFAAVFYDASINAIIICKSSGGTVTSYNTTSTLTSENFLGFSSAAYSDGNTATIKVVGNTVTGLSGLTPISKYYCQMDGSLGLTPVTGKSALVGRALTSSSLLINPGL